MSSKDPPRLMPATESVTLAARNIANAQRERGMRPDEASIRASIVRAKERGDQIRRERGE